MLLKGAQGQDERQQTEDEMLIRYKRIVKYLRRLFRETVEFPALEILKGNCTRPWTCFKVALNELRKSLPS